LGEDGHDPKLFVAFAQFEERMKEIDRARVIYKYALDHISKEEAVELYKTYTSFEKQHGSTVGVEDVIFSKRRFHYEEQLQADPLDYDVWFDYIRLEESMGDAARIRTVYERAIANLPPIQEKKYWARYIYLWINFAVYEELTAKDAERTRLVYQKALEVIPHKEFTFSKVWLLMAQFEIRHKNLDKARQLLGQALGMCPREKLFKGYLELELQLGMVDRCRKLYEKYLQFMPENCYAWSRFAELEASLSETDRARAIFELAIDQKTLDMPEVLWKAYIDFEIKLKEHDRVRELYKRLLQRTEHVKVWISRAQFEASIKQADKARPIFEEAEAFFKSTDNKEERVLLLEAWRDFERNFGTPGSQEKVAAKMPRRVKKRRQIATEDGEEAGWEEYWDYIFPGEEQKQQGLKILEMARKWKKQKTAD
jgi:crooked neck